MIERGVTSGKYVQGHSVAALEKLIEERWRVAAAVAVNSGSSALRLALEALQLEAGSEVLVPALTFISTAYAVSDAGLVPVFVDVDPQTLTMDPEAARAAITEKTVAMVPVHLYGQMADMFPLLDLADSYGLTVVEDAAQAHGATYTGSFSSSASENAFYAGSMGELGVFLLKRSQEYCTAFRHRHCRRGRLIETGEVFQVEEEAPKEREQVKGCAP